MSADHADESKFIIRAEDDPTELKQASLHDFGQPYLTGNNLTVLLDSRTPASHYAKLRRHAIGYYSERTRVAEPAPHMTATPSQWIDCTDPESLVLDQEIGLNPHRPGLT